MTCTLALATLGAVTGVILVGPGSADLSQILSKQPGLTSITSESDVAQVDSSKAGVLVWLMSPDRQSSWSTAADGFVPSLEKQIEAWKLKNPTVKVVLSPPIGAADSWTKQQLVPLLNQVARETGSSTLPLSADASDSAYNVFTAAIDWSGFKANWRVIGFDSEQADEGPADNVVDGDPTTYWHTQYSPTMAPYPHWVVVDMGRSENFGGFRYLPRQDGGVNGRVKSFNVYLSDDGKTWGDPVLTVSTVPDTSMAFVAKFPKPASGRYFKFEATAEQYGGKWASAAELDLIPAFTP